MEGAGKERRGHPEENPTASLPQPRLTRPEVDVAVLITRGLTTVIMQLALVPFLSSAEHPPTVSMRRLMGGACVQQDLVAGSHFPSIHRAT